MELNLRACHRQFLESYLLVNKLSLQSLSNAVGNAVSASTLSRVIKKDRNGHYAKSFKMGLDSWIDLVTNLKLTKEQSTQAILLRVKDQLIEINSESSMQVSKIINKVHQSIESKELLTDNFSNESLYIADTYDKLPSRLKKSIALESFKVIGYLDMINPSKAQLLKENRKLLKQMAN